MSSVVYARVPDALKQALAVRSRERGLSVTAAVVALLERGRQPPILRVGHGRQVTDVPGEDAATHVDVYVRGLRVSLATRFQVASQANRCLRGF